jgi:hypothetical protein
MENSMEIHGIQWNSMENSVKNPLNVFENSMEFHGIPPNFPRIDGTIFARDSFS